ncbi:MAG TPA: phosphodiesterase [Alphaproteobacteria bacterium]
MLIAQISDLHVRGDHSLANSRVPTNAALEACVAHLNALDPRPDVVLATGDLTDFGTDEDFAVLRALLAPLAMPVFMIPGNHDDRAALRRAFPEARHLAAEPDWIQYTIEDWPVRLIALDTVVPGQSHGALCAGRLAWLDARLAEQPERSTVIFMHHPPFKTGIAHMDDIKLVEGEEALGAIVRRNPQVERVLCGHVHRPIHVRWRGTIASIGPSPAHQVMLDLRPDGPAVFKLEPPACQLHLWRPDQGLISHLSVIGDYPGPFPFHGG